VTRVRALLRWLRIPRANGVKQRYKFRLKTQELRTIKMKIQPALSCRKIKLSFRNYIDWFSLLLFKIVMKISWVPQRERCIYIVDIDNTLAHTWPSHTYKYSSQKQKYLSLSVMWKIFHEVKKIQQGGNRIVFLSARKCTLYFVTMAWLKSSGMAVSWSNLFLVSSAEKKIAFLEHAIRLGCKITYIDDLSGNHEKGEVIMYEGIINKVKKYKEVEYLGYEYIDKVCSKRNS
jgi:hypothetical protein